MSIGVVSRSVELRSIAQLFSTIGQQPSGLLLEGEAGIGKTTLWLAALQQARAQGFRVLSARAWEAESVLAYGTVADLLADIDVATLEKLPEVQRIAVDRVLLREASGGPETDQHVVAAALLSAIEALATDAPVVVGIDDVQWLDPSSKAVVAFVARRLRGRVGLIVTERTDPDRVSVMSWLQLARPDAIARTRVRSLSMGGLHELLSARLGRAFPRPAMVRIAELSGGNPFYALEMAPAIDTEPDLPRSLSELVRIRIAGLDPRHPGRASGGRLRGRAHGGHARPRHRYHRRAHGSSRRGGADPRDHRQPGVLRAPTAGPRGHVDATAARRRRMHRAVADVVDQPD